MSELLNAVGVKGWLDAGGAGPVVIQAVDLTPFAADLAKVSLKGSTLLGCGIDAALEQQAKAQGGHVVPDIGALKAPFTSFPTELYDIAFLYRGFDPQKKDSWIGTPDHIGWKFFMETDVKPNVLDMAQAAAARLHDTSLERATARFLETFERGAIAIMGGHDIARTHPAFKQVVQIARDLRRKGFVIVTGGGPGLMEAGNLGAFLAPQADDAIDAALADLPEKSFKSHEWLATGAAVRAKFNGTWSKPIGADGASLAIPTWLYGHEPPNMFASRIAKMHFNSLREDGLVSVAGGGIIFGPGNAGTVQEIFQDMTQNYYRNELAATPMVFLSPDYWSRPCDDPLTFPPKKNPNKPLLPLIRQLAAEKDFLSAILVSDNIAEVVKFLDRPPPKPKPGLRAADVKLQARL